VTYCRELGGRRRGLSNHADPFEVVVPEDAQAEPVVPGGVVNWGIEQGPDLSSMRWYQEIPAHPPEPAGTKYDAGKPPMSLIPRSAHVAEAEVLAFGAKKYAAHNWRAGFAWSRLTDAAMRHLTAFIDGEDVDPETGLSHIAHLRCCTGFLLEHIAHELGTDDRYKRPK
jgi:hypothetical protein